MLQDRLVGLGRLALICRAFRTLLCSKQNQGSVQYSSQSVAQRPTNSFRTFSPQPARRTSRSNSLLPRSKSTSNPLRPSSYNATDLTVECSKQDRWSVSTLRNSRRSPTLQICRHPGRHAPGSFSVWMLWQTPAVQAVSWPGTHLWEGNSNCAHL